MKNFKVVIEIGFRAWEYYVISTREELEKYLGSVVPRVSFVITPAPNVADGIGELSQQLIRDGIA